MRQLEVGRRELAPISFRAGATSAESASLAAGTYFTINEAAIQTRKRGKGRRGREGGRPYLTHTGVCNLKTSLWGKRDGNDVPVS